MSVSGNEGPGQNPGLFSSLRSFWSVLVAILYTRLDLATSELEELGQHTVRLLLLSLAALLCVSMTIFFLLFFLVVVFWEERELVLGIIFVVCALASTALIVIAKKMIVNRPKLLAHTLAELRRDVDGLRKITKTEEAQS